MSHSPAGPTRPFEDLYLLAYSEEHVKYEVAMFLGLVQLVTDPGAILLAPTKAQARCLRNALVESCALHLRNILSFLYPREVRSTDVVAGDYLAPQGSIAILPPISATLEAARGRANKEVSHLTTERLGGSPPGKAWNFVALHDELVPVLRLFAASANGSRLSPAVAACLKSP